MAVGEAVKGPEDNGGDVGMAGGAGCEEPDIGCSVHEESCTRLVMPLNEYWH